ncbi:MAG: CpXC domain-containing protein [Clostridia bacterium]|nr:CpXC domain-containing protein [Clostridia bacterium]
MSMRAKVNLKCPKCGKDMEIEQWSAVNGDKNPQQKMKILEGTLFTPKCPMCGNVCTVGYPMIYHDTRQNYMIWLIYDEQELKHVTDYFKKSKSENYSDDAEEPVDRACRQRAVFSPDRLREKIMIFDSGLDDKLIEIMKLAYAKQVQLQLKNDNIAASFFSNDNGQKRIEMYTEGGRAFTAPFTQKVYRDIDDKYSGRACYAEDRVYVIDDCFALDLLRSMR